MSRLQVGGGGGVGGGGRVGASGEEQRVGHGGERRENIKLSD